MCARFRSVIVLNYAWTSCMIDSWTMHVGKKLNVLSFGDEAEDELDSGTVPPPNNVVPLNHATTLYHISRRELLRLRFERG